MKSYTHAYIAYIVGRLLTGKRIASLYDFNQCRHIEISSLPYVDCIKEFDHIHRHYIPGYSSGCRYLYPCGSGLTMELSINGNSFMGHIRGGSFYFVGNVRGDSIYIFDHEESVHINYKISGCLVERDNSETVCSNCWYIK
ncbi:MAG: hypothetical protein AB1632_06585 [Nitrospirota bacterium]